MKNLLRAYLGVSIFMLCFILYKCNSLYMRFKTLSNDFSGMTEESANRKLILTMEKGEMDTLLIISLYIFMGIAVTAMTLYKMRGDKH